ncbi:MULTISPECIES: response regulator transcription factor [unclassified Variovorax]|uniref:response regulator transcription factor n=1 Tax=unclassified Variovorax TaxID=663243 RepID=UPI001BD2653C|nr:MULTISPECIES: response regulator [unclassified Variovorax]
MDQPEASIAVVDDEPSVRVAIGRMLRSANFRVCEYASGESFLESLSGHLPLSALLDLQMPGLSGFDVLERMRAANVDVPVIVITASDDANPDRATRTIGVKALLRKPFTSVELCHAIGIARAHGA